MTPEGRVKAKVKAVLARYAGNGLYVDWPVPSGYGTTTLDAIGWYRGQPFAIETKAPGKKPTLRQVEIGNRMAQAGAKLFIIDGVNGALEMMVEWLEHASGKAYDPYLPPDPVRRRTL